ncbi:anhydro-N-acetylmuramic acid kinase [Actinophytocola gossypii]|uniref:Anhydro-N-acetylmuramic acid kinase n=1 Tax=Actinophytocola gossypii TaxID=2812003 RepID=A0ABT2JA78_9PSEU|nr:anhydro-N-acetylmuramic acid kinase [Actinophytocola gossypii]MCT2584750.1 anhydro-N-acetylmuramic acid kinase [Actinophytocola gossypii]
MTDAVNTCRVIGLLSGTSMDGVDVAVAELRLTGETIDLLPCGHAEVPFPTGLRGRLLAALPPSACTAEELCRLDTEVGQAFAAAAADALSTIAGGRADLVASLGQTLYHWVADGRALGTLQVGQPAWIAETTGLPVVADLRARDVAAGGHGAPLASVLDQLWLRSPEVITAGLNIGGIANVTVVPQAGPAVAFDTGPGNALLDAAARMISNGVWQLDVDGDLAAQGRVDEALLDVLLADPYYALRSPKSTGKEHFHGDYLRAALAKVGHVSGPDLLATLVELTAATIADACRAHGVTRVVAAGGGVRNPTLMAALRRRLAEVPVETSDELGLPAAGKEAYLTALLGFLTWQGVPANEPHATGAAGPRLLGSVTPGRVPLRLPEPTTTTVTRLRVTQPAISGR